MLVWWRSQSRITKDLLFVVALVSLVSALAGAWLAQAWDMLLLTLGIEFGGAGITFVLLERILAHNENRKLLNCRIAPRIRSRVNSVALEAIADLQREGWLYDGSLRGAYLSGANLTGADLQDADLQNVLLIAANLEEARLRGTDLRAGHLWRANLRGAEFLGANLLDANLEEAEIGGAVFDTHTMLPDGSYWRPGVDVTRFTDPDHPDAWQRPHVPGELPSDLMNVPWGQSASKGPHHD